jgi:hypothetical protein
LSGYEAIALYKPCGTAFSVLFTTVARASCSGMVFLDHSSFFVFLGNVGQFHHMARVAVVASKIELGSHMHTRKIQKSRGRWHGDGEKACERLFG